MTTPSRESHQQIYDAYVRMAEEAHYRPMAPSDGMGGITVPPEELDLDEEARKYVVRWWHSENDGRFRIGSAHFTLRPAMIFAIEAARLSCTGSDAAPVVQLLRMAHEEAERVAAEQEPRGGA